MLLTSSPAEWILHFRKFTIKTEKPDFLAETGPVPSVSLRSRPTIDIYLKNRTAPRKKPISIEIIPVTFFTIILMNQNNNNYNLNLGRQNYIKIGKKISHSSKMWYRFKMREKILFQQSPWLVSCFYSLRFFKISIILGNLLLVLSKNNTE